MNTKEMIHQYLLGNLDEENVRKLDRLLADDPDLRREFALVANVDAALRETSIERSIEQVHGRTAPVVVERSTRNAGLWLITACVAIAASVLLAIGFWDGQPAPVATLASSEDAAWESALPTSPGSDLTTGTLSLKSGLATVVFRSGAELTIEAPAELTLISAMRAKLNSGAAVMDVPKSAKGFVLETPDGYAIDFGTRFAVRIDGNRKASNFELIEGEIEVHHPPSGESLRLNEVGSAASVSAESMELIEDSLLSESEELSSDASAGIIRIATEGRCGSAIRNLQRRKKAIRPEYLYVKLVGGKWDMRSFFGFDLGGVPSDDLNSAKLRINQVPSYRGNASLLPKINRFAFYGLTNPAKEGWEIETTWEDSPGPDDGVLLGTFEIPRSQQRGKIEIETPELLSYLKGRAGRTATLILVRETKRVVGVGPSMTHMFASDKHPEAVGPLLELGVQ